MYPIIPDQGLEYAITEQGMVTILALLPLIAYLSQRRFRDPLACCGYGCLHLPTCGYYEQRGDDRRFVQETPAPSSPQIIVVANGRYTAPDAPSEPTPTPLFARSSIIRIFLRAVTLASVFVEGTLAVVDLWSIRQMRASCRCSHRTECLTARGLPAQPTKVR